MKILVCNIGWMKRYRGEDDIHSSAAYVQEHGAGYEMCNFLPVQGRVFGYVKASRHRTINIERLGAQKGQGFITGVLVIWTAPQPGGPGRKVIGWYRDATVHRKPKPIKDSSLSDEHKERGIDYCYIEADEDNIELLEPAERTLNVPMAKGDGVKGGMGNQSAIWFPDPNRHDAVAAFLEKLGDLVGNHEAFPNKRPSTKKGPPQARNRILYGPPGTGKTYETVRHAFAIIDRQEVRDAQHHMDRFRGLRFDSETGSGQIAMITFHQSFAYEDFVEGIRPVLGAEDLRYERRDGIFKRFAHAAADDARAAEEEQRPAKPFVLIIDEINRGNIAKILGELITLLEDSRRVGRKDETRVTLPYSGEEFGVPDNLYVIGTMNTADRSIQLLDTALRRRFEFIEMMPDADHSLIPENVEGIALREMLRKMNERITLLLDREHQIGHTYLFGADTMEKLSNAFRNKIFPLLQEYFFDDWSKIRAVLGGNRFVKRDTRNAILDAELPDEEGMIYERLPGSDSRWRDPAEYQKIYETGERGAQEDS